MKAIVVDDSELSLEILQMQLSSLEYFDDVQGFVDPAAAVAYVKNHKVDIAFLDIVMNEINGITLAGAIRAFLPGCYIIFVTASSEYALDAFKVHATGYLLKPVTMGSLREQLDAILVHQTPTETEKEPEKKKCLSVQCFGNFEAFDVNGKPLSFRYQKTKELLAYLIHRKGAVCNNAEIAAVLYEDREDSKSLQSQIRNLISDLNRALRESGASAALYRVHNGTAVVPDEIDCDYYNYLEDKSSVSFNGEYMIQYDWSEVVNAFLTSQS